MTKYKILYLIILALICILLFSCDENQGGILTDTRWVKKSTIENTYEVAKIDGCEYIYVSIIATNTGLMGLTHKGNCSNPIHKCNCK